MRKYRNLDEEYPQCGHWDCVVIDCTLSVEPCLFCVVNYEDDEED